MGTSLAAIGLIALVGAISYALHGEVKPGAAAIVGHAGRARGGRRAARSAAARQPDAVARFAALLAGLGVWLLV